MKIVDIFSANMSSYLLGSSRIRKLENLNPEIENIIITSPGEYIENLKKENFKYRIVQMNHTKINPFKDCMSIIKLKKTLKQIDPDIVQTHNSKGGIIGRLASKRAGVPFIIHQVHGFYFKRFSGIKRNLFQYVEKFLSKYCDLLLFQNKDDLLLAKKMGIPDNKITYIGNGINFDDFKGDYSNKKSPSESGGMNLIYVGRMDKNKNHKMVLDALDLLVKRMPFSLHLIGDGPLLETLKNRVNSGNLKGKVIFHGFLQRKEIPDIARLCHLNLLTSKQEGKPRTVMETSYMGIPTIATDIEGTKEVVIPGINGELVEYDDYSSLAKKISDFYNDETKWKRMSLSSKKYAENNFDEMIVVKKLNEIYMNHRK